MIREKSGDILQTECLAIAHGVAPNDDFHSGLALQLREQWPAMYKDFRHYCHDRHPKEGELWMWSGVGGHRIICLFTQAAAYGHGKTPGKAHLEHVGHSLKALRHLIEKEKLESVAIPRLATGVGGLDWEDVYPLVKQHLGDLEATIEVYTVYKKEPART